MVRSDNRSLAKVPHITYSFIEKGQLAIPEHEKYMFPLQDPDSLPVLLIPDFLNAEEFLDLRRRVHHAKTQKAFQAAVTSSGPGKALEHTKIPDVRQTSILPLEPLILTHHKTDIQQAIRSYWRIPTDWEIEPKHGWQCLQYGVGSHYRWHSDGFNFREGKWHLYYPERSIALIFFMSNWIHGYPQQEQFSGGELVFTHIVDQWGNRLAIYPKANTLVAFPTTHQYLHQVNQVREGERISFVNWW